MRFAYLYGCLIALQSIAVQAQNIPACAASCLNLNGSQSGCSPLDVSCYCTNVRFVTYLSCCLQAACSPPELVTSLNAAQYACAAANISVVNFPGCESRNGTYVPVSGWYISSTTTSTYVSTATAPLLNTASITSEPSIISGPSATSSTTITNAAQTAANGSQSSKPSSGLTVGAGVGIAIGSIVALLIIFGLAFVIYRQKKANAARARYSDTNNVFPSKAYPAELGSREHITHFELGAKSQPQYELSTYGPPAANRYELEGYREYGHHK